MSLNRCTARHRIAAPHIIESLHCTSSRLASLSVHTTIQLKRKREREKEKNDRRLNLVNRLLPALWWFRLIIFLSVSVMILDNFLPWMMLRLTSDEKLDVLNYITLIIPKER
ncbi:hypothetical protein ACS0TY_023836 [Phlomoides rotata]